MLRAAGSASDHSRPISAVARTGRVSGGAGFRQAEHRQLGPVGHGRAAPRHAPDRCRGAWPGAQRQGVDGGHRHPDDDQDRDISGADFGEHAEVASQRWCPGTASRRRRARTVARCRRARTVARRRRARIAGREQRAKPAGRGLRAQADSCGKPVQPASCDQDQRAQFGHGGLCLIKPTMAPSAALPAPYPPLDPSRQAALSCVGVAQPHSHGLAGGFCLVVVARPDPVICRGSMPDGTAGSGAARFPATLPSRRAEFDSPAHHVPGRHVPRCHVPGCHVPGWAAKASSVAVHLGNTTTWI